MSVINLTREFISESIRTSLDLREVHLKSENTEYTGMVWNVATDSMVGTYIDFPGHIKETDDGIRGDNINAADFYRKPSTLLQGINRELGAVTAEDLRKANGGSDKTHDFLVINALCPGKEPHDIDSRSVYLDSSAVDWIINSGCKVLISDIYESKKLEGVFLSLFKAGISTVCEPVNLWKLKGTPLITIGIPNVGIAQIPSVLLAEIED